VQHGISETTYAPLRGDGGGIGDYTDGRRIPPELFSREGRPDILSITANERITRYRTAAATLKFMKRDGTPLAGRTLSIAQKSHHFLFGCNGFPIIALVNGELEGGEKERAEKALDSFMKLFNFVTLPFYWGQFEPRQGHTATDRIRAAARWFRDRGLLVKGHTLCWHTLAPDWLLAMDNAEILRAQRNRIKREVSRFGGLIDMWDVINEAVIMPVFARYDNGITRIARELGRTKTIKTMFDEARAANPSAVLLINDFDVSPAYDILIEACLEAGVKIDVIGIQSHMHQGYWGAEKTLKVLEQFERFNLPIHFSESTIVSGRLMPPDIVDLNDYRSDHWPSTAEGEERQAREVLLHYETLFSHPLVSGISWWDFSDGQWLAAPSGLIRKDASVKPAYEELLKMVKKEWWMAPAQFTTDAEGRVQFSGFFGEYEVSLAEKRACFSLVKEGPRSLEIHL
jgi:endo-1,4-beta-xylanase